MFKLRSLCVGLSLVALFFMGGCNSGMNSGGGAMLAPGEVSSVRNYPDRSFNARQYVRGMVKGGRNLLIWQDPDADFSKYSTVDLQEITGRLLPYQERFSYGPFIKAFDASLSGSLSLRKQASPSSLRIEGSLVECNPGSRAARYLVGMGAGKAAGAVAIEVFEPGKDHPSLRIYARDTASAGGFGGDSVAMMSHIFKQISYRVATILEAKIGM